MQALDPVDVALGETVRLEYRGARDRNAKVDAVVFQPAVAWRVVETDDGETAVAVARSVVDERRTAFVPVPIDRPRSTTIRSLDESGELVTEEAGVDHEGDEVPVPVEPCGFSIVRMSAKASDADD